jgi:hypothetical protein
MAEPFKTGIAKRRNDIITVLEELWCEPKRIHVQNDAVDVTA